MIFCLSVIAASYCYVARLVSHKVSPSDRRISAPYEPPLKKRLPKQLQARNHLLSFEVCFPSSRRHFFVALQAVTSSSHFKALLLSPFTNNHRLESAISHRKPFSHGGPRLTSNEAPLAVLCSLHELLLHRDVRPIAPHRTYQGMDH